MHVKVDAATAGTSSGLTNEALAGRRIHMIGVGGSGMCGAATLLAEMGARVSGSDLVRFDGAGELARRGVEVSVGHSAMNLRPDAELVVTSAAIPASNPELMAARERRLPVLKYAELLGAIMAVRQGAAIAGTHGKSTTSGLTIHLLRNAGLDPSFVIGARSNQLGGSSGFGRGPHFVVEACEFDRSFLQFRPQYGVILNIESDHLDCYRDIEDIIDAFGAFARNVPPRGLLICNADDGAALRAACSARARVETFGVSSPADWEARDLQCNRGRFAFDVRYRGRRLMRTKLAIPGRYNVSNALASIALAHHCGAEMAGLAAAVETFEGVDRRLSRRGERRGVTVLDDYAHHPTEVRVTIEAARARYEPKRTYVVFQPHQTVRTRHFMSEFATSFGGVDEIIVPDVYGARESGATTAADSAELVARICRCGGAAQYMAKLEAIAPYLAEKVTEGDLVLVMGAGDVGKVADELVERLSGPDRTRRAAGQTDMVPAGRPGEVSVSAA
jgi:UDP-N-acetylmuramate--alanine ligase